MKTKQKNSKYPTRNNRKCENLKNKMKTNENDKTKQMKK